MTIKKFLGTGLLLSAMTFLWLVLSALTARAATPDKPTDDVSYDVLTLRQALTLGYDYDPRIKAALADVNISDYNLMSTRASRLPQVNMTSSFGSSDTDFNGDAQESSGDQRSVGVAMSAPILTFGRQDAIEKSAKSQTRSARYAFKQQKGAVFSAVIEGYFTLLLAEQVYQLRQEDQKASQRQLAEAKVRFDRRAINVTELLSARVAVNDSSIAMVDAESRYQTARQVFVNLIGTNKFGSLSAASAKEFLDGLPKTLEEAEQIVLLNSSTIKNADEAIVRGQADIEQARANFFPNVSLQGGVTTNQQGPENSLQQYVTMNFNMQLFSGGTGVVEQMRLASQLKRLQYDKSLQTTNLLIDLRNQWQNYQNYNRIVNDRYNSLVQYQKIYNAAERSMQLGQMTITQVISVRQNLVEQYISYAYAVNSKNLIGLSLASRLGVIK